MNNRQHDPARNQNSRKAANSRRVHDSPMSQVNHRRPNPRRRRRPPAHANNTMFMLVGTCITVMVAVIAVAVVLLTFDSGTQTRDDNINAANIPENPNTLTPSDTESTVDDTTPTPEPSEPYNEEPDNYSALDTIPEPVSAFSTLSFYIPESAEEYQSFQDNNPLLDPETVVWKVNASLHLPFFYEITTSYEPTPLLINSFNRLPSGFSPQGMLPVNNDNCPHRATPQTVQAFRSLRQAARSAGFDISVVSAYRSAQRQREIFERQGSVDGAVMRPYHSEHQTGRALDLWGPGPSGLLDHGGSTPTGEWVAANVHNHGFILRYPEGTTHITGIIFEPWHITYVGMEIATYMHTNGIDTLEEFVGRNPGAGIDWAR